jgi:hypothetical protein
MEAGTAYELITVIKRIPGGDFHEENPGMAASITCIGVA